MPASINHVLLTVELMFGGGGLLCDLLVNPLDPLDELVLRKSSAKVALFNFDISPSKAGW